MKKKTKKKTWFQILLCKIKQFNKNLAQAQEKVWAEERAAQIFKASWYSSWL